MRAGSPLAGTFTAVAMTAISACLSAVGALVLLALWHDPQTMAAIQSSGGLAEVFELPVLLIVPAAILGTLAGAVGATIRRWHSAF